jgi:lipopolysaccharide transport system ATP-binding protein
MSDFAIRVEHLAKHYRLGRIGAGSLKEDLARWWERRRGGAEEPRATDFWALRDVSFEVRPGEVLGIIGSNGAGKSTLLKILSRITEPTKGRAVVNGRLASLLEVGTGFHPDLTGRENIFLNGAIMGLTRADVHSRLEEIIEFSGISQFIDTPVKRYSSGMFVRLAFAVAAHLDAEVMIIDEVLAVGDAQFQQKCLGKMESLSKQEARTVLFVSHNLGMVRSLCTRALMLERGSVRSTGTPAEVIRCYLNEDAIVKAGVYVGAAGSGPLRIERVVISQGEAQPVAELHDDAAWQIDVELAGDIGLSWSLFLEVRDEEGNMFLHSGDPFQGGVDKRTGKIRITVAPAMLAEGSYVVNLFLSVAGIGIADSVEGRLHVAMRYADCRSRHDWWYGYHSPAAIHWAANP